MIAPMMTLMSVVVVKMMNKMGCHLVFHLFLPKYGPRCVASRRRPPTLGKRHWGPPTSVYRLFPGPGPFWGGLDEAERDIL